MIILVPYFGDTVRFRPLLDKWLTACRAIGFDFTRIRVTLLTDNEPAADAVAKEMGSPDFPIWVAAFDLTGFRDLIRPNQPFDVKGALVCSYLLRYNYGTLVLDADAVIVRDPTETLKPFVNAPIAMPKDDAAIVYFRKPSLEAPYQHVRKLCAGVMYFGVSPGRGRLVAGYRRAFEEMRDTIPWSPRLPHLLEQNAWSLAHHRRGGATLPRSMNWSARHLGDSAGACILHDYGRGKWA